jgi:polyhydroxyalkanoate synthesis regulator phasin
VHSFFVERKNKMKKIGSLLVVFALLCSGLVVSAAAHPKLALSSATATTTASDTSGTTATETGTSTDSSSTRSSTDTQSIHGKSSQNAKKQFRDELNTQKKECLKEKSTLNQQLETLQAQYDALVSAGDTEGAAALQTQIDTLNTQISDLNAQIKKTMNERYMLVKTMYSEDELAKFGSAAALIAQMYQDASTLGAGSVTVNNNLIKFDAPAYIKGGTTLVPVRAITEGMGAEVSWDAATQTATITKGDTVVKITANSTSVTVNGVPVEISQPAEVSCNRTYVPLRFLAELFHFDVTWDGENQEIDIDDGSADSGSTDSTSTDTTSTDTMTTDATATDTTATDATTTDTTSATTATETST